MARIGLLIGAVLFAGSSSVVSVRGAQRVARPAEQPPAPIAIPMELLASRPLVRVTVNGQGPFPFLVGPEDRSTLLDENLAEVLKLRERAATPGEAPELQVELGFGPDHSVTAMVRVVDLGRVVPEVAPAGRPRGVISLSVWKDHLVTMDYARFRLTVEPGALPAANGKDVLGLTASGELHLPLTIAEHSIDCRVDPLFHGGLLLPASSIDTLPLDRVTRDWSSFNARSGTIRVKEARLSTNVMLGPFEVRAPLVLLSEQVDTATIGAQWLGRFAITYDLVNLRARLERPRPSTDR